MSKYLKDTPIDHKTESIDKEGTYDPPWKC